MNKILDFNIPIPKIGVGKHKNQAPLSNNVLVWKRYYETKIKKKFKDSISEWIVPQCSEPHKIGSVVITIIKNNKRSQDADSIMFISKWVVDKLVDLGYFEDDDRIVFVYKPFVHDKEKVEHEINVKVYDSHII
jgi:hypothetical protein